MSQQCCQDVATPVQPCILCSSSESRACLHLHMGIQIEGPYKISSSSETICCSLRVFLEPASDAAASRWYHERNPALLF